MQSSSEITRRDTLLAIARWVCILPGAMLGDLATSIVVRAVAMIASSGGLAMLGQSSVGYWSGQFLCYAPPKATFVVLGAKMAPRSQVAVSIALAVLGLCLSLLKHVLGQYLAGNRVGFTNYMHFCAESAGLLCGAAYMARQMAQARRKATQAP